MELTKHTLSELVKIDGVDTVNIPSIKHPRLVRRSNHIPQNKIHINVYENVFLYQRNGKKYIVNSLNELQEEFREFGGIEVKEVRGKTFNIVENGAALFSHWMFDSICKYCIIRDSSIDINDLENIIVNTSSQQFQKETINLLDLGDINIIERNKGNELLKLDYLIDVTPIRVSMYTRSWQIEFIRDLFSNKKDRPNINKDYSKIFINRSSGRRKVIDNSDFHQYLKCNGFEILNLENYSVTEAKYMFERANVILGPHGAGFSNIVFCKPNTLVIELFSQHISSEFYNFSEVLNLNHKFVTCNDLKGNNWSTIALDYKNNFVEINSAEIVVDNDVLNKIKEMIEDHEFNS